MTKKIIYVLFLFFLDCSCQNKSSIVNKQGFFDLSKYDFNEGPISLKGDWFFHCGDFIKIEELQDAQAKDSIPVPSIWRGLKNCKISDKVTYWTTIKLPKDQKSVSFLFERIMGSYKVFFNEKSAISFMGEKNEKDFNIQPVSQIYIYDESQSDLNLYIYIDGSSGFTNYPGIIEKVQVGSLLSIKFLEYKIMFYELILSWGIFFFIVFLFYNGLVYYKFDKRLTYLFVLFVCFTLNYLFLLALNPFVSPYGFGGTFVTGTTYYRINNITASSFALLFFLFLYVFSYSKKHKYWNYVSYIKIFISIVFIGITSLFLILGKDSKFLSKFIIPSQIDYMLSFIFILWLNKMNFSYNTKYKYDSLIASVLYISTVMLAIIEQKKSFTLDIDIFTFISLPLFFSVFLLGYMFFKYLFFYNKEKVEQELKIIKDTYNKLIPEKILKLNQTENILDFKKNKQVEREFIFSFIKLVPNLKFEMDFFSSGATFVNSCYKKINSIILKNSGVNFSYTYENNLIAIFEDPIEATRAATEITKIDFQDLKVFISLHVQKSQMKVIGAKDNCRFILQPSYIESLLAELIFYAEKYSCQIVASESFISKLPFQNVRSIESKSNEFYHRPINLCSKEYFEEIIYEIFELSEENKQKIETIKLHNQAFNYATNGNIKHAIRLWASLLKMFPDDPLIHSLMVEYKVLSVKKEI